MPTKFTSTVAKLFELHDTRKAYLQSLVGELGMAWEYVPLMEHIRTFPGCMQADISKKLKVTAAAVTQSTQKLEKQGLIKRIVDEDNQRAKKLYLTEKGLETLTRGTAIFDHTDKVMFKDFSDAEQTELMMLLDKLINNISNQINNDDNFKTTGGR
ncbi:MAG: MarR family transcriptional regulator [Oscillospiraceae bacterium]|nr:MarR family transcriptional regulator [Oscillospiraceae bacterium]